LRAYQVQANRSGGGGDETALAFDGKDRERRFREQAAVTPANARRGLETIDAEADTADLSESRVLPRSR